MTVDELWPGGPKFCRGGAGFALGTDSVLLANFPKMSGVKRVLDIGCGAGVISIILAHNNPSVAIDGIEIMDAPAELSRENVGLNNMSDRVSIITGDIRRHRELFKPGAYDLVITNPPYFTSDSGKTVDDPVIASARDERNCTLADICAAGAYLTKWGGKFAMVHRPERMAEVICAMSAAGLEPKRLRMVQYRTNSAPNLFLIEARRGGKPSLSIEPPLILTAPDGGDSDEIIKIYHRRTNV